MKKKNILIVLIVFLICVLTGVVLFLKGQPIKNNKTEETIKNEITQDTSQDVDSQEEPIVPEEELFDGTDTKKEIPSNLFLDEAFPLTLKSLKTGDVKEITANSKFVDFFEYQEIEAEEGIEFDGMLTLLPDEGTQYLHLIDNATEDTSDDEVFVFGAINQSEEQVYFKDARVVYMYYRGLPNWEICGVNTEMSPEDVIKAIGEPSQKDEAEEYKLYEYYIEKDGHTYSLLVEFDANDKLLYVSLNIDNDGI